MLDFIKSVFGGGGGNDQLQQAVSNGAFLVDVRTPAEFADGHVKGSVNIPLDRIQHQLSKFKGKQNIVVFCRSGARSAQAKNVLEQNGFKNVVNGGSWTNVRSIVNN